MKLITKEIENRVKELGSQEDNRDPIVVASFLTRKEEVPGSL